MGLHEEGGPPPGDGRSQQAARAFGDDGRSGYNREVGPSPYKQGQHGPQQQQMQHPQQMRQNTGQGMNNRPPPPNGPFPGPRRQDSNPQDRGIAQERGPYPGPRRQDSNPQDRGNHQQMRMNDGPVVGSRPPQGSGPPSGPARKYSNPQERGIQQDRDGQQPMRPINEKVANNNQSIMAPGSYPPQGPGPQRSRSNPQDVGNGGSGERSSSRTRSNRKGSGQIRRCNKCGEPLTGQFVRALGGTYHLDCFKCKVCTFQFFLPVYDICVTIDEPFTDVNVQDCGEIVASKFFPVDDEENGGQYPLCETDYFGRLGLLCHKCNTALRGSYITALDNKYHVDHFTCSMCPTIFGAQDSYYEHEQQVYCHYHYSTQFAQRCYGCQTAILKQFVEIYRNGQNQHWHPECYMIHKFWNVRLADSPTDSQAERPTLSEASDEAARNVVRLEEEKMEEKVYRIWSVLSTFEECAAANISTMLLSVSNGAYAEGVLTAKEFIWHVDLLFKSADKLDAVMIDIGVKGMSTPSASCIHG